MKIVAVKCPACYGAGKNSLLDMKCMWCEGKKRLRRADALRYADHLVTLGVGGYICGDHDLDDQKQMLRKADKICRTFGVPIISPGHVR